MLRVFWYCLVLFLVLWASEGHTTYGDELPVPWSEIISTGCNPDPTEAEVTQELWEVFIEGEFIYLLNSAGESPGTWYSPDGYVDSNLHIIMWFEGSWYSSPWDYGGIGQQRKHYDAIGDIPEPYNYGWKPVEGEDYYFYLSTICRDPSGPSHIERTNVVKYRWFGETGYPPEPVDPEPPKVCEPMHLASFFVPEKSFYNHYAEVTWHVPGAKSVTVMLDGWPVVHSTLDDSGIRLRLYEDSEFAIVAGDGCGNYVEEVRNVSVERVNVSWLMLLLGD